MYVLDTNAFYYAAGISPFSYDVKKLQTLIANKETVISTTSLFEFLIKNKDDIATIRKGGKYLYDNNIKVASNVINPLPEHFSDDLVNITEQHLDVMCKEVLENKIDVESRFIALLFDMCLFSGYYFTAMSEGVEPCEYCFSAMATVYKLFGSVVLDVFKERFEDGYKTNDCENYIRNCFYNLLEFMLENGIPYIEKAKSVTSDNEYENADIWFPSEEYAQMTSNLNSIFLKQRSTAFLQRLGVAYKKKNNDPELKNHIQKLKEIFNKKIKFEALQDYFYDTLVKIHVSGAALRKNDLLDAIILCNLQNDHVLITYDNGVIERMEKRKSEYSKYQESINIIKILKQ